MLEVLQFIFSDFWHWLGTLILISSIFPLFKITITDKKSISDVLNELLEKIDKKYNTTEGDRNG